MNRIMIVDDNITNLAIAKSSLEDTYEIIPVSSGEQALKLVDKVMILPDLILLDIDMPIINGFSVISELKTNKNTKDIPVIFLTAQEDSSSELEGLALGAIDYIKKPFSPPLLKKRIELHFKVIEQNKSLEQYNSNLETMINKKTQTILELQYALIATVSDLIGKRDGYTGEHVNRTAKYMEILLYEMIYRGYGEGMQESEIETIAMSSELHDVGKIAMPDTILLSNRKLKDDEFKYMKFHTTIGAEAIKNSMRLTEDSRYFKYALQMVRSHHEKWDGTGYPDGLKGENIPLVARILAVADVYDALRSKRTYKDSLSHKEAVDIIISGIGTHFDPRIIKVFSEVNHRFEKL